ncbi:hypothetical protein [Methylophaga sp.]|uniref:phage tail tip protein J-related protein n=1 Tax=Methylophaga sp. TaxID=2024840 RepID=UPI003A91ED68
MAVAVAAVGAAIWANAGAIAMATIAIASAAYSYSMSRKAKKMANEDSTSERKQIVRSSSLPENHIFGKRRSSGLLFFANEEAGEQDDGEWIHMTITHAGHNLSYIGELLINEEDPNNYAGFYEEEHFLSGLNVADNFLLSNCPDWKENMIGKGFSWGRISMKFDQEKYPTGLPNVNWLKHGYAVYDPRDGATKFTENSALCILHALRNIWGWEDEFIIIETFIDAANICDELVNDPDGGIERRYIMSAEFDDTDTPVSVLEKMLATCAGEWVRVGGRLGLRVGAYYGPAFIEITEDDLIGPIDIQPEPERKDAFNIVRGSYVAPDQNYETVDYPEVRVDEWVIEDGEEVALDLDLTYVPSPYQAQRLADLTLMRSRYGMTITLPCNLRGFKATPGTMIKLSLPTIGFDDEFMVVDWDFNIENGVNLTVRRDLANFYDDAVGKPITTPPLINLPTGGIAAPGNPQFAAQQVGDVVQGVITWQNAAFKTAHTNVIIKNSAGFIVQSAQVPFPSSELPINGRLAGNYSVELFSVGVNGAKSVVTEMSFVVAAPSTPDEISIRASNWAIYLIPVYSAGTTPYGTLFEFYLDTSESTEPPSETRQPDEIASSWTTGGLTPDTNYYYWIRAVNSYGKSGWVQKTVKTTKEQDLVTTVVERLEAIEIVSRDYVEGESGYKLSPGGDAEFNNIKARGEIIATKMTFSDENAIPDEINNANVKTPSTVEVRVNSSSYTNTSNGEMYIHSSTGDNPFTIEFDGGSVTLDPGDINFSKAETYYIAARKDGGFIFDSGQRMIGIGGDSANGYYAVYYLSSDYATTKNISDPSEYVVFGRASNSSNEYVMNAQVWSNGISLDQMDAYDSNLPFPTQNRVQISSDNYSPGSRGWAIHANGDAEFNNGVFRGALYASDIQGNITSGKGTYVNAVNIDSSGWTTVATISWKASSVGLARNVIVLPIEIFGLGRILVNGTQRIITEPVFGRIGAPYGVTVYVGSGSGSIQLQLKKWTQGGTSAPSSIYNQYLNALLVPASSDFN